MSKGIGKKVCEAILGQGKKWYTLSFLVEQCGGNREAVRVAVNRLVKGGLIAVVKASWPGGGNLVERTYKTKDHKALGERAGKRQAPQRLKAGGWDKLWKQVRVLRRFSKDDLIDVSGLTPQNVTSFLYAYRKAGYLKSPGRAGGSWRLVKDPGPARPGYRGEDDGSVETDTA